MNKRVIIFCTKRKGKENGVELAEKNSVDPFHKTEVNSRFGGQGQFK